VQLTKRAMHDNEQRREVTKEQEALLKTNVVTGCPGGHDGSKQGVFQR
jgi:hypothetical protein